MSEPAAQRRPSYSFAKRHGVLVGELQDHCLTVYQRPDTSLKAVQEIRRLMARSITIQTLSEQEFEQRLTQAYDSSAGESLAVMEDIGEDLDLASLANALPEPQDLMEAEDDAPIIRLLNALLSQAVKENASDIHIETFEQRLSIRLRVDGVLREAIQPPKNIGTLIVSRIKVMANLDIAEKRLPQDGRISLRVAGRPVDVRVSTLPSGHGERVVMRLLDKQAGRLDLSHLGLTKPLYDKLTLSINKPHGVILVTGPTGSGKTTTLYAALSELNSTTRNVLTVEDPIEYFLDGIGQTQVNTKVDMTFARGLRAILRQDPDVVMVGEIRDVETAQIAVQASLTGHLVFSTLHTNTAVGAITRMRDMGVEPFLLASSLLGVMAQRLVRILCEQCKQGHAATAQELQQLNITLADDQPVPTLYAPMGCAHCNQSGYVGRSGIYEYIELDSQFRSMMHDDASEQSLEEYARTHSASIRADGYRLVLAGKTTLQEVMRVTREN